VPDSSRDGESCPGLRRQLARIGREVVRAGLVVGSGGNLSARKPGSDRFWVTAAGTWLDRLVRPSFARVNLADGMHDGSVRPTTELGLHLATYRARPDVNAIIHLHPQTVILLDALGERIRLVTTDHAVYVRRVARVGFHPPGSTALAEAAGQAVVDGTNCVILAHHGCSVLADSPEMAHRRVSNLEEAARLTFRALLVTGGLRRRSIDEAPPVDLDIV
jgi:ribulose-5-phosphate 4-epimerase/fuculose-1-phosphate aldolase